MKGRVCREWGRTALSILGGGKPLTQQHVIPTPRSIMPNCTAQAPLSSAVLRVKSEGPHKPLPLGQSLPTNQSLPRNAWSFFTSSDRLPALSGLCPHSAARPKSGWQLAGLADECQHKGGECDAGQVYIPLILKALRYWRPGSTCTSRQRVLDPADVNPASVPPKGGGLTSHGDRMYVAPAGLKGLFQR